MKSSIFLVLITLIIVSGCVEKTGYYGEGEKQTISLICNNTWESERKVEDNGMTHYTVYKFEDNGTYTRTFIDIDADGKIKKSGNNGNWTFYDQSSKTLFFGYDHYWDIEVLTKDKFEVWDRWRELGNMNMSRDYLKLAPHK